MTDHQQGQQRKLGFEVPFHFDWLAERDSLGGGRGAGRQEGVCRVERGRGKKKRYYFLLSEKMFT